MKLWGINKISTARILNLANFKESEAKGNPPGLIYIAIDHVVTLFEVACADFSPAFKLVPESS